MKYPLTMELAKSAVQALMATDLDPDLIPDVEALIEELHDDGYLPVEDRDELLKQLENDHGRR